MINRETVIHILAEHLPELQKQYPIKSLALFGSVVRGEATENSDVDLLVEFTEPVGFFLLDELEERLQALVGCKVDLVTTTGLRPQFKDRIYREAMYV